MVPSTLDIQPSTLDPRQKDRLGLTHGFRPKMAIFPTFFLGNIGQGKSLLRYSRTKKRLSRL